MFSDKGKLRDPVVGGPALQEMLKEVFHTEGKYTKGKLRSLGTNEGHQKK